CVGQLLFAGGFTDADGVRFARAEGDVLAERHEARPLLAAADQLEVRVRTELDRDDRQVGGRFRVLPRALLLLEATAAHHLNTLHLELVQRLLLQLAKALALADRIT